MKETHTHTMRTIIKFLNIKGTAILKASYREKQVTKQSIRNQKGIVFLNIYTENYEAMENVLKILMKNYFQTRIPYPAKSSSRVRLK